MNQQELFYFLYGEKQTLSREEAERFAAVYSDHVLSQKDKKERFNAERWFYGESFRLTNHYRKY